MIPIELTAQKNDARVVLESEDKNHTVLNLVKKYLWKTGAEAGYDKGHPYTGGSQLILEADDPEQALQDAVSKARESLQELRDATAE